ncbi:diaminopropionate ammonia-lyase [Sulfurospirillum sp. 1307]|jgi:diaminopropionate ammonia-lyase
MLKSYLDQIEFFDNSKNLTNLPYTNQDILSLKGFKKAFNEISSWPNYKPTPLVSLDNLAKETGVSKIYYKNEHFRFDLKSFKALGGAYALLNILLEKLKEKGMNANSKDLFSKKYASFTNNITVVCATDGNHGKSVAWGANMFGCKCEIFIHSKVSKNRKKEIEKYNAVVHRIEGNYDESVKIADKIAKEKGYIVISDTSYEGYTKIPKDVMQGYSVMVYEALEQMRDIPTHIFMQGGVGGLAASIVSYMKEKYPKNSPIFVMVEPKNADCLLKSAKNKTPTIIEGELDTIMAGLSCGEVSLIAWQVLKDKVKAFVSIPDEPILDAIRFLANQKDSIIAGESAVAGLAGFLILQNSKKCREILELNESSKILFFGTEGNTDELLYKTIINS